MPNRTVDGSGTVSDRPSRSRICDDVGHEGFILQHPAVLRSRQRAVLLIPVLLDRSGTWYSNLGLRFAAPQAMVLLASSER